MKMLLKLLCISSLLFISVHAAAPAKHLSPTEEAIRWDEEYRRADAELNKVYQELLAGRDAEGKQKLRVSQRAWLVFRDAEAEFVAHDWLGGSGQAAAVNGTLATLTRDRVRQLKDRF